jgi:hypothetical protein
MTYSPYMYEPRRICKHCGRAWRWHNREDCSDRNGISLGTRFEPKHQTVIERIEAARRNDPSFAHVLLHGAAGVYNHTPHPVRQQRLVKFEHKFPELVSACLRMCSQTGKV